jgi:hypothetical protein
MTARLIDVTDLEPVDMEGVDAMLRGDSGAPQATLGHDRGSHREKNDSGEKQKKASFHDISFFGCAPRLAAILLLLSKDG